MKKIYSIGFIIGVFIGYFVGKYYKGSDVSMVGYFVFIYLIIVSDWFGEFYLFLFYMTLLLVLPLLWYYVPTKYNLLEMLGYSLILYMVFDKHFKGNTPIFVEEGDITKFPVECSNN